MKVMFLDESGNHDLRPERINPNYPVFVLAGVIVDRAYARTVIEPQMRDFKLQFFGRDDIILHTKDMHRLRNGFESLANRNFRLEVYKELNAMIDGWDFKIVACAIKLNEHVAQYGSNALDPYMYSLDVLVERFCKELDNAPDQGFICAEMRNPRLDQELRIAWEKSRREGTAFASAAEIDEKIVHLTLKDKKPNIAGMQLADLVASPVGRGVLKLPTKDDEVSRRVVKRKFRRGWSGHRGYGLVVLPSF